MNIKKLFEMVRRKIPTVTTLEETSKRTLLEGMMESIPDTIYFKDKGGRFVEVSDSKAEELGVDLEDVIGKTDFDFYPEEQAKEMFEDDRRVMEEEEPVINKEEKVVTPTGEEWWASVTKVPRYDEDGNVIGLIGISRDITQRKELEEELSRERTLLESLLENLPISVYFKDKEGRHIRVSDFLVDSLDPEQAESRSDVIGKTDFDLYPDELAEKTAEDERRVMETEEPIVEREEHSQTPAGEDIYHSTTKAPLVDEKENVIGLLGFTREITDRKLAEERTEFLHSLLRHDVRNKAQVALGYLDMLSDTDLSEEQREMIERGTNALDAANDLIEKVGMLREIDREGETGKVNLDQKIKSTIKNNKDAAAEEGMDIEYGRIEVEVQGSPLLEECFSNLIENSIKHSGGSLIRITGQEDEDTVTVSVEDDGKGIPDEMKEKVFERAYSGEASRGTGMGTYLVKMIAQACGGDVTVKDSELGGARFDVTLNKALKKEEE